MSVIDSPSDYSDDGFVVPDTPEPQESSSRPTKRQRLEPPTRGEDRAGDHDSASLADSFSDWDEEVRDHRDSSAEYERQARSKSRSFVPKHSNFQENMFVTQLTQPDSSPERIRGPRWKKPDPTPVRLSPDMISTPPLNRPDRQVEDNYYDDDEEELRAALEASLDAFEEEKTMRRIMDPTIPTNSTSNLLPVQRNQNAAPQDASFELDNIPDDAFVSSPCLSPVSRPVNTVHIKSSFSRPQQRPQNTRQTTLYGLIAQNQEATPTREQDWAPSERTEPPTQHKLNQDTLHTWWYPTNLGTIRDYQFNIAQKGLFHNLLVALPTGLGKTFIAATIMLNWFRWTKDAQIIFVAPTKPLVSQQVSACLDIAGIPRSQTTMLTGGAAPGIRAEEWQAKRVFFMTPQTLINDLKTGIADPKRIVLLVVDEAHRATGGYAYVEVVKFLRRYNKSFRVLALTATPGSTVESVQAVIDGLDISRVEIRTENSIDIRDYVHARNIEIETFENSDEMTFCMELLSTTLRPLVDQLRTMNAYWGRDPMGLTAFGLTKARQQWMGSDAGRNANFGLKGKVNAIFTVLASLAHAIDLLKYHGIVPFYRHILHFKSNTDGQKGGKWQKQVVQDESFKKLVSHLEPWTKNPEFIGHPKLEYLKSVILNHFMDAGEGKENLNGISQPATRVMIFVHFRDSAEEVVRVLQRYAPMIRPHVFVGQSSAKGSEGMDQKTQLQIIEKFKGGTYNTIVATSIGEEGLDIGEVDLIVCYDSSASPIRMLQRMGRTGRKRAGNITLLLMKGKEEDSYVKAKDNYEKMQQMIASGSRFTFHEDRSARILPAGIRPTPDKRQIDIPPENSQQELPEPKRRGRAPKRPPKKFHMPDDVETGFTRASTLEESFGKAKKKATPIKRPRTPTPEPVDVPLLKDVFLTEKEQRHLEHHYQNIGDTSPQFIRYPRNDAFPELQLVERPTKLVKHGSLTRRMIAALQKMSQAGPDCEDRFKEILACEAAKLAKSNRRPSEDDLAVDRPRNHTGVNSRRGIKTPHRLSEKSQVDLGHDDMAFLSPYPSEPEPQPKQQPPSSLERDLDDNDSDFEFPDASFLFEPKAKSRKQGRIILDSDE
ncbi:ATP-dependent DNA helicase mph1 [Penicillium macrosclerotiorum]|uniref:ATP-dependent DNA helicase mph1 n=1 Tax=Penicillium macrosclerotiorum TaxID=303699 RepID=UPI002548BF92|nr:ATP-dependent DNA helicase mph1 [Penicillium macrosclerotiorum]KAJ5688566.1 ATP-dependent DNA helicase mph1 [Penicillium macrosclerotiorum]